MGKNPCVLFQGQMQSDPWDTNAESVRCEVVITRYFNRHGCLLLGICPECL